MGSSPQSGTASQGSGDTWQHGKAAVCWEGSCRCSQPLCRGVAQQLQRWHRCRGSADERDPNYRELLGQGAEPQPLHAVSGTRMALGSWLLLLCRAGPGGASRVVVGLWAQLPALARLQHRAHTARLLQRPAAARAWAEGPDCLPCTQPGHSTPNCQLCVPNLASASPPLVSWRVKSLPDSSGSEEEPPNPRLLLQTKGSFPHAACVGRFPQPNLLCCAGALQHPHLQAGAGEEADAAPGRRDLGTEAQKRSSFPPACAAGQGFRISLAARAAKGRPVTISSRSQQQQEAADLQSQSGHPCTAAANAPNRCEIPGICWLGTASVVPVGSEQHPCSRGEPCPDPHPVLPTPPGCGAGCCSPAAPCPMVADGCIAAAQQKYQPAQRAGGCGHQGFLCMFPR